MAGPAALDGLRQRFAALWTRCLLPGCGESPDPAWRAIAAGYGAHDRHYHSSAHLAFCLAELDVARALATDPDALETAIWFHDVVLDPGAGDNETRSCALFEELAGGKLAPDLRRRVCSLFLATTHRETAAPGDAQLMADIDLASLGRLEKLLTLPEKHLEFHTWYLKEKGWIRRTDGGQYEITANGVDAATKNDMSIRKNHFLLAESHGESA